MIWVPVTATMQQADSEEHTDPLVMNDPDIYISCWLMCIYQGDTHRASISLTKETACGKICILNAAPWLIALPLCVSSANPGWLKCSYHACCCKQIDAFSGRWEAGNQGEKGLGGVTGMSSIPLVRAGVSINTLTWMREVWGVREHKWGSGGKGGMMDCSIQLRLNKSKEVAEIGEGKREKPRNTADGVNSR